MKRRSQAKQTKPPFLLFIIGLFGLYLVWTGVRTVKDSLLFVGKDRINVVFVSQNATYISIGYTDNVHYRVSFPSDTSVIVPGGYGDYSVGALGKLSLLEKDPDIIKKTISSTTSSYVDYYFLHTENKEDFSSLSLSEVFFPKDIKTNANFIDRLLLYQKIGGINRSSFHNLKNKFTLSEGETYEAAFSDAYMGYFYKRELREENKSIQIRYDVLSSATILSRVLEGEGIHVVDLANAKQNSKECILTVMEITSSKTIDYLMKRFSCKIQTGDTGGQDIIIDLGTNLQEIWE